ncbi:MAG: PQQ-dependent sugar dehydrogenase [Chloroflexota bacterium]
MLTKIRIFVFILLVLVTTALVAAQDSALDDDSALADDYFVTLEPVVTSLFDPVGVAHTGDERLFVVERSGRIQIIENGQLLPDLFLDLRGRLANDNWEQGLLGLVFHPEYDENGYFYVNYTGSDGDTRISRFQVSEDDPNRADVDSEQVILLVDQPEDDHNAGALAFGPDGYLYVALGDGGLIGGYLNAQEMGTLLGKILRIDVDGEAGGAPDCDISGEGQYTVPTDNPFYDGPGGACDEIWVLGLRNPWRFSFDSASGDMFIGDVGLGHYEEVNVLPAEAGGGANFGWPCYEGYDPYRTYRCDGSEVLTFPVAGYAHSEERNCEAMVTGEVYHGEEYPEMQGHLLFADFCGGRLWRLRADGDGWQQRAVGSARRSVTSLGAGADGELYVTSLHGGVYRVHLQPAPHHTYLPLLTVP